MAEKDGCSARWTLNYSQRTLRRAIAGCGRAASGVAWPVLPVAVMAVCYWLQQSLQQATYICALSCMCILNLGRGLCVYMASKGRPPISANNFRVICLVMSQYQTVPVHPCMQHVTNASNDNTSVRPAVALCAWSFLAVWLLGLPSTLPNMAAYAGADLLALQVSVCCSQQLQLVCAAGSH